MPDHKNVVVAVRCRPLNSREKKRNGSCLVTMQGQQTILEGPAAAAAADNGQQHRSNGQLQHRRNMYNFDYSYWSATDASDPRYASQETVFEDIGTAVLDHALSGYNCCVFAYGQTGSGKSYTMMGGPGKDAGLIPRICQALFAAIGTANGSSDESFHVEVSYLEIYNERVRDLLNPRQDSSGEGGGGGLRVREHPSLGPYVEDLTKAAVSSIDQVLAHMSQGNKARTVAATNMNEASSRSHAVFTIMLARRTHNRETDTVSERVARISLVDLAGSERATSTMATGVRLKEGARINQSLASLGKVISALADQEERKHKSANGQTGVPAASGFVPYRDSVLTWLLKDSLGGNSRTIMIATISPSDYGETLSTLRYADRAKHIVNVATVNEDATVKLVRKLKEEIAELRKRLSLTGPNSAQGGDLEDQLVANEKLIAEMNQTWEQKLQRTQTLQMEREEALAALGIAIDTNSAGMGVGLHAPRDIPHLVNLSEDPLMSECLVYNIKPGRTLVGTASDVDIRLGGNNVCAHHCWFEYDQESSALKVCPIGDSLVLVNGQHIEQNVQLYSGFRVIIGSTSVFRLNHPLQARRDRERGITQQRGSQMSDDTTSSEMMDAGTVDWHYAWNEAHRDENGNGYSNDSSLESPAMWANDRDYDVPSEMSSTGHSFPTTHALDIIGAQQLRPSSQLSFRRNHSSLVQQQHYQRRWRRNSSAATDIVSSSSSPHMPHSPLLSRNLRTRGHTLSVVTPPANGVRSWVTGAVGAPDAYRQQQAHERRLAQLLLRQWRQYRLVKVGEEMLRNAVHLKEANVIAKELGQKVVYQFAILRGGADAYPESPLEPDALPAILSDWDTITIGDVDDGGGRAKGQRRGSLHLGAPDSAAAAHSVPPQVVVKVLDIAHTCWYVWSVATLHTQLDRMRRLSAVSGSYRAHLELDPFHAGAPRYSCIGTATYPVWPGTRAYSTKIDAPVIDSLSRLERGRARGSMAALPVRGRRGDARAWTVIIHIRSLHGVNESELSEIHCRMRLARLPELLDPGSDDSAAAAAATDKAGTVVLVSASADRAARHNSPVRGFGDGAINIQFRQQWTVDMLAQDTCVVVDFFGRAKPLALRRAFHEDVQMEHQQQQQQGAAACNDLSSSQRLLVERLHEEELFVDSTHEVALWIRVLELDSNGDWEQAPCEFSSGNPTLTLRQGVQRRVEVVVGHNTSTHLRFECIEAMCIGRPELVDAKGRLAQTQQQKQQQYLGAATIVELPGVRATVADQRIDNRCFVSAIAPWDSSVLGSRLLDAPTARGMRVRLALELHADIANGTAPLVLATTFHVRVCARQSSSARGSGWLAAMAEGTSNFLRSGSIGDHGTRTNASSSSLPHLAAQQLKQQQQLPPLDDGVWRVFAVTLGASGPLLRGKADMWRLNTGNKYVRGEEALLPWRPRSVAFVEHFHRTEMRDAWRLRVARTRERLEAMGPIALRIPRAEDVAELRRILETDSDALENRTQETVPSSSSSSSSLRQQHVLALVREAVERIEQTYSAPRACSLGLFQEPQQQQPRIDGKARAAAEEEDQGAVPRSLGDIRRLVQRTPIAVRPIEMRSHGLIRGWVDVLDTNRGSADAWVRRWLVVERPYLLMFVDDACRFLDNVVGIASARVEAGAHVSEVAGRPYVVALYASTSAHLLAPPASELQQWIAALDEWYFML